MAFEPLGYGDKWYDRIMGRRLKAKEFATIVLIAGVIIIAFNS